MTITIDQESFQVPDSWNSLSGEQYSALCQLIHKYGDPHRIKVMFLFYLLHLKVNPHRPSDHGCYCHFKDRLIFLDSETIAEMTTSLDFLFSESGNQQVLNPTCWINHFRDISLKGKKYYGPADKLVNLRFNEFIHADSLYHQFISTSDEKYLDKFLGSLWREKDPQITEDSPSFRGDLRIPFNPYILESQSGVMSLLNGRVKLGCFLFYAGSRNYISGMFPNLFSLGTSGYSPQSYMTLCYDLCNNDVSRINRILDSFVYDVFMFLENSIKNKIHSS
jgi:hypothetical protein